MYFSGEAATNFEKTVLDLVESALKDGFAAPALAAKFKKFGGVPITRSAERGLEYFADKRPWLFLQLDGDDPAPWTKRVGGVLHAGNKHSLTVGIECISPDSVGERALRDAARDILNRAYPTFRDAGLEGSVARVLKPEEHPDRRAPVALTAWAYTL